MQTIDITATPDQINGFLQIWKANGGNIGKIHDGYHSFDELYEHRIANYIQLCSSFDAGEILSGNGDRNSVWKSKAHSDGSVWDGWFILGIHKEPGKQITYHLPMSKWEECRFATELERAPDWDGHSSADVLERLKSL